MRKFLLLILVLLAGFANPPAGHAQRQTGKASSPQKGPLKKDGTPDMRYKENKKKAKAAPHLKKDGTPDKRYKENK